MDRRTMERLDEETYSVLDALSGLSPDTEEYSRAVANLKTLGEVKKVDADWKRLDQERLDKQALEDEKFELEKKAKKSCLIKDSIFKGIDIILTLANLLLPMAFYSKMWGRQARFEKDGFIASSSMFKSLIGKLHPTKKL